MRRAVVVSLVFGCVLLPLLGWAQGDDALTTAAKQVTDRFVQSADAKRGEVAEVDATTTPVTIYVLLGQKDGVQEGNVLNVVSKGDPIVVAGETVGFKEKPVGTAEITRVQSDRLSVATMKTTVPGQQPEKGCMAYLKTVPGTLAVSTFLRADNAATMMGQEFADKLGMVLQASGRFQMVERTRFEAVLKELGLSLNDLFDPTKAARLGKQLQAKGVVMGTITQQNDRYAINARVVDVETGVQVATAAVSCGRSTELDGKYAGGSVASGSSGTGVTGAATARPPVKLFDACKPFERKGFEKRIMGTCPIGGKLYDDCVVYTDGFAIFDLKSGQWDELRFALGRHDTEKWRNPLSVTVDGNRVYDRGPEESRPLEKDVRIPLKGIRMLRLDAPGCLFSDGVLIPGDFILIPAGGGAGVP